MPASMKAAGDCFLHPADMEQGQEQEEQEEKQEQGQGQGHEQQTREHSGLDPVSGGLHLSDADITASPFKDVPLDMSSGASAADAPVEDGAPAAEGKDGTGPKVYSKRRSLPKLLNTAELSTMKSGSRDDGDDDDDSLSLFGFMKKTKALARKRSGAVATTTSEQALRASSSGAQPLDGSAAKTDQVGDAQAAFTDGGSGGGTCEREDEGQDAHDSDMPDDDDEDMQEAGGQQSAQKQEDPELPVLASLSDSKAGRGSLKGKGSSKDVASTSGSKKRQSTASSKQKPSKRSRKASQDDGTGTGKGRKASQDDGTGTGKGRKASQDDGTGIGTGSTKERRKAGKRAPPPPPPPRQPRKRRHDDMAYEGDVEWEVLMGDPEHATDFSEKDRFGRGRSRAGLSSPESDVGEVAAVAAGLKARAPGPSERIHFKEALKRRGGLGEYLEYRNKILGLWDRDVKCILSVEDCIRSLFPSSDTSPRSLLVREIHEFLEIHGYINTGLALKKESLLHVEKDIVQYEGTAAAEVNEVVSIDHSHEDASVVDDDEAEAALILGQIRGEPEKLLRCVSVPGKLELDIGENGVVKTPKSTETSTRISDSDKGLDVLSAEGGTDPMDIDVAAGVHPHPVAQEVKDQDLVPLEGVVEKNLGAVDTLEGNCGANAVQSLPQAGDLCGSSAGGVGSENKEQPMGVHSSEVLLRRSFSAPEQVKKSLVSSDGLDFRSAEVLQGLHKGCFQPKALYDDQTHLSDAETEGKTLKKTVVIVGAGPAGLTAARHLQRMKFDVIVLEARNRVGGRVYTDRSSFSAPVDLGASIITGVEADVAAERRADPSALLCRQLGLELTTLRGDCPLYDSVTGLKVPADVDAALEAEYNSLLDDTVALVAHNGEAAMRMSLGEGLEYLLDQRRASKLAAGNGSILSGVAVAPLVNSTGPEVDRIDVLTSSQLVSKQDDPDTAACQVESTHARPSSCDALQGLDTRDSMLPPSPKPVEEQDDPDTAGCQIESTHAKPSSCDSLGDLDTRDNMLPPSSEPVEVLAEVSCLESESQGSGTETQVASPLERRIMDWHFANLEYGCAAELCKVSLPYWNQDDIYGGFGGPHCMIKGGYSTIMEAMGENLNIHLGSVVTRIAYSVKEGESKGQMHRVVNVKTENGEVFDGDAVLITVPLGCLKGDSIEFEPSLPDWKLASIQRLGFGLLNKLVMEFPSVFWDETVDYFGATAESTELRGKCFMFWNLKGTCGVPILIALVVGSASYEGEMKEKSEILGHALGVLRKLFGEENVPDPVASVLTNWGSDPYSRGAYSYVALGASGEDYDILGRPVEGCLFFAGEGTCKEHPDTVGGAMMSGLREAIRIFNILENRGDSTAEAEAMAAAQRQSDSERNEVRDMEKRLSAAELSNALRADVGSLHGEQRPLSQSDLLKDMFHHAKTTAGRLFLAKEMLLLPVSSLKSFAGTKVGLSLLNTWILDSMGKDGTQLLRLCVRLLLSVATDLLCIRQSGIARTVKEKVCAHTSRDIRAVAGQLVKKWVEVFRKEKAIYGIPKLPKKLKPQVTGSMKAKGKDVKSSVNVEEQCPLELSPAPENKSTSLNGGSPISQSKQHLGSPHLQESSYVDQAIHVEGGAEPGKDLEAASSVLSETEAAALAAAEAAQAAAKAAAEAYARAEAERNALPVLPKIPSFHKFSKQEQLAVKDEVPDWKKKKWSDGAKPGRRQLYSPTSGPLEFGGIHRTKSVSGKEQMANSGSHRDNSVSLRDHSGGHRDHSGGLRDHSGGHRDHPGDHRDHPGGHRDQPGGHRDQPGGHRDHSGGHRDHSGGHRDHSGGHRDHSGGHRDHSGGHRDQPGGHQNQPGGHRDHSGGHRDHSGIHRDNSGGHRDYSGGHRDHSGIHRDNSGGHRDHSGGHRDHSGIHRDNSGSHRDMLGHPSTPLSKINHQEDERRSLSGRQMSVKRVQTPTPAVDTPQEHDAKLHIKAEESLLSNAGQGNVVQPTEPVDASISLTATAGRGNVAQAPKPVDASITSEAVVVVREPQPAVGSGKGETGHDEPRHDEPSGPVRPKSEGNSRVELKSQYDQDIKKAVAEYIGHLLTPLYKSRKIDKETYKTILRGATAKVMERKSGSTEVQDVSEFLNVKRKSKIRSLVDKYIEKYMTGKS